MAEAADVRWKVTASRRAAGRLGRKCSARAWHDRTPECGGALNAHRGGAAAAGGAETGKALRTRKRIEASVLVDVFISSAARSPNSGRDRPVSRTLRPSLWASRWGRRCDKPWNVPIDAMALKIAPRARRRNAVVVKYAGRVRRCSELVRVASRLWNEILPPGVQHSCGNGSRVREGPLVAHTEGVKVPFRLRSSEAGTISTEPAGRKLITLIWELGGKKPDDSE